MGAFPVWRPNLDELDVDSAPASAFLIPKSFKIIPLQLGCRVPARVLACLLSDGPGGDTENMGFLLKLISHFNADFVFGLQVEQDMYDRVQKGFSGTLIAADQF